jgi:hypothetical protein
MEGEQTGQAGNFQHAERQNTFTYFLQGILFMTASIENMTKANLITLVQELQAKVETTNEGLFALNAGKATRERKAGKITFNLDEITVEQTDGKSATFNLAQFFAHSNVMAHLLQYAIVRASTDSAHEKGMVGFMDAWAKGFTSPAEYERSLKPVEIKAAASAKAPNIGGLTDAEIIATIENLGGEFDVIAATLMTVDKAMFAPAVRFLSEKHPEVANALKEKVEAKRMAAIEAQKASLAALFG